MATTVGQHSVAAFTSPINGTTPIDANTVRSNDNTVRLAYVDHDADTGIHVQSSTLASRPVAGTAGRKWITEDSGVYTLWFDDGVNWHPVSSENIALTVLCTTALNKGDVVKVVGWNNGQDLPEVAKVSSASDIAFAIMTANATINTMGYATNTGIVQDINTAAFAVGDILYPSASGGFTTTKPTSGLYQIVAYVLRSNSSNGVVFVEFSGPRIVEASANTASTVVQRDASGNFSAGAITASSLAGTLTTAAQPNITSVGTLSTLTVTGQAALGSATLSAAGNDRLIVSPQTTGGGTLLQAVNNANSAYTPLVFDALDFRFRIATAERMRLDNSGNLGIGVTPSTNNGGNVVQVGAISGFMGSATESYLNSNATFNTTWQYIGTATASQYRQTSGQHVWRTAASGTAGTTITWTEAMRIDASGNLGLGTASPTLYSGFTTLDIDNATNGGLLNIKKNGTTVGYINGSSGMLVLAQLADLKLTSTGANTIQFSTNATERARIDASGNFGIGTAPLASDGRLTIQNGTSDPSIAFKGRNTDDAAAIRWQSNDGVTNRASIVYATDAAGMRLITAGSYPIRFETNSTARMWLDASGNLGLGVTPSAWWSGSRVEQVGQGGVLEGRTGSSITAFGSNYFINSSVAYTYLNSAEASRYEQAGGQHQWFTAPSGTAGNAITFTQRMTLDANGYLLINTAGNIFGSAGRGLIEINGSANGLLGFKVGDVAKGYIQQTTSDLTVMNQANGSLFLGTNNTNRATLDASGNLALASGYMRVGGASAGAASTTTIGNTTATTVGAAGGASALPATPLGYIIAHVGTTQVKIPYYTA